MIFLLLSISCTAFIYLLFQVFTRFKVDLFPAIVINYFTCVVTGLFFGDAPYTTYLQNIPQQVFSFSILLGCSFVSVFYLMSSATQLLGVAGGTIVSRMSMIIPAAFAVFYLHEPFTILKACGVLLALTAIYFTVGIKTSQEKEENKLNKNTLWIPIGAFFGVGLVDVLLKYSQVTFFGQRTDTNFVGLTYFWAFVAGSCIILFLRKADINLLFKPKNLLWGFVLGIPNYFGIYLFYKALSTPGLHGSTIFPINSVGTVALSSLAAIIFLGEKINLHKIIGLLIAIAAIFLLSW